MNHPTHAATEVALSSERFPERWSSLTQNHREIGHLLARFLFVYVLRSINWPWDFSSGVQAAGFHFSPKKIIFWQRS